MTGLIDLAHFINSCDILDVLSKAIYPAIFVILKVKVKQITVSTEKSIINEKYREIYIYTLHTLNYCPEMCFYL